MAGNKVVVAEFKNALEAQIAIGHLESAGIEASMIKDDAGGMFPSLQQTEGVQVLVAEVHHQKAQAVLREKMD